MRIVSLLFALASFVFWSSVGLSETIVPMVSDGGTFRVPVTINGQLTVKFVIDSGAADVSVPADVVMTLVRTGTITDADFLGKQTYQLADGSTVPSQQFVIRSLRVGDETLENVVGSIAPVAGGLLLGQSFLSRFNTWSIDNHRQALILGSPPPVVVNSPPPAPSYGEQYSYPVNLNPNGDNFLALHTQPWGPRIMKMGPDTLFTVVGEQGDWANVRLRTGETGWAAKAYIGCCKVAPSAAAQPVAEGRYSYPVNLNPNGDNFLALRTEPGGVRIMKMGPDTLFTVVGEQGDWANVRLRTGETGWAAKAYIGCCVTAPAIGSER
jgi:gag-polyprotein putative aspartyl protease